jgi:hypothetical protein
VSLQARSGEPRGLTAVFTREVTPDAGVFLRLQRSAREAAVVGGVQVRF